jgi:hypothetical protein
MATIDIGPGATDRAATINQGYTLITPANPANNTGIITSIEIWAASTMGGVRVGTFYLVSGSTYKCRDSVTIGTVTAGSKQTFSGLSITVNTGDFIGCYFTSGQIEADASGGNVKYASGEHIDPGDEASYSALGAYEMSLYGTGTTSSPQTISPTSITQPISLGTPTVQLGSTEQTIVPSSILQAIVCGTPVLLYPQTILPSSITQAVAYGTPKLVLAIKPLSIVQAISVGTPIVTLPQLYESYTEESAYYNVYGAYWRSQTFTPQSSHKISSLKFKLCRVGSPGTGTVSIKATDANGKPTGADLCSASIDGNSLPTDPTLLGFSLGAGANLNADTKYAIVWRFPSGDASNYARTRHMYPGTYTGGTAVTSSDGGATWEVVSDWDFVFQDWGEPLMQTVYPDSTVQPISIGSPIVYFVGTVYPTSVVQPIAIGIPTILGGIPSGIVWPESTIQQISIGSPTILKYVWHVILDGNYITATPPINRVYVIGRDADGNPVYGTAVDSTELGLVGERLDFQQELAIPTNSQAEGMANAILSKMRLSGKRGVILIPPNCGQELWDVVQLTDKGANQEAIKFRVVGIRFEYNPKQARYHHKLILGAP